MKDMIHVFSSVPRDLNFIDHTSDLGWKEVQRVEPVIVDAAIYLKRRSSYFQATEKRKNPDAFKFFTAQEGYSPDFQNTTVNNDLRYMAWDNPPGMEPHFLNITDYEKMIESGVPFARQFYKDDRLLDKIDHKILGRWNNRVAPAAWCSAKNRWWSDPCSQCRSVNTVKPGPQSVKFGGLMRRHLAKWMTQSSSCK